jgi:uncharacterized membrane protein
MVAALLLVLLAPSTFRSIQPRQWRTLQGLRLAVIVLVALAMLRPTCITTDAQQQSAVLIVMLDFSRSMDLPNSSGDGKTRWEAQAEFLKRASPLLAKLDKTLEVRVYGFGGQLVEAGWDGKSVTLPLAPNEELTDIGTSLHEAVRREAGHRIAGVLLLSDGSQTAYQPQIELHRAGRELARLDCPLYAFPFGAAGDATQFADVAVANLPEQYTVFVKNKLTIEALLRVRGYVNRPLPVELEVTRPDGGKSTLGPFTVTASSDGEQVPIKIPFTPDTPGSYTLTVRVPPQNRERVTDNNQLTAFLTVRDGGLKVAYLIGSVFSAPPGEQIRLRRALAQSPDIELEHRFIYDASDDRSRWPVDLRDILDGQYDVVLMENVDSSALGKANIDALAAAIDSGQGFMMIGGFYSFSPGGFRLTKMNDVLPIEMPRFVRQELGLRQPIQQDLHLPGPLPMLPARTHPITRLATNEEDNQALWRKLPPLLGANRFTGVKPRAQVLAESPKGEPLLVAGEYGQGRVLAFAGDSTRRWTHDYAMEHKRFWRQAVLWLAHRDAVEKSDVWIRLTKRRYDAGARIEFTAGAKTGSGDAVTDAQPTAWLVGPQNQRTPIELVKDGDKWRGDLDNAPYAGRCSIRFSASQDGQPLGEAQADFLLTARDIELGNPAADPDQLARLAATTQDSGGRIVSAEQGDDILQDMIDNPPDLEIAIQKKWQLGASLISAWLLFLIFALLLGIEWFLRKRWRLV